MQYLHYFMQILHAIFARVTAPLTIRQEQKLHYEHENDNLKLNVHEHTYLHTDIHTTQTKIMTL